MMMPRIICFKDFCVRLKKKSIFQNPFTFKHFNPKCMSFKAQTNLILSKKHNNIKQKLEKIKFTFDKSSFNNFFPIRQRKSSSKIITKQGRNRPQICIKGRPLKERGRERERERERDKKKQKKRERKRERKKKKERERKRKKEKERKRKRERKKERGREGATNIKQNLNDTYLFVK